MNKSFFKILILLFITIFISPHFSYCDDFIEDESQDINSEIIEASTTFIPSSFSEISDPKINSRSAVVIDRNTNTILYGKNENEKRKMASTTKIMTATIIIENCNLNDIVTISKRSASTGGSRLGLKTGDKVSVNDLLYGLMMRSGNDSAVALAEYCSGSVSNFAEKMNLKATELGLTNTHFDTPHGLDSNKHYTTSYELAILTNYALNNPTFRKIVGTKNYTITINGNLKQLSNTNELLGNFDGVYGVKTGFTNGANRCLVTSCKRNNLDIICVVLGADTKKYRTQDSIKLLNYVLNNFEQVNIKEIISNNFEEWKSKNLKNIVINKADNMNDFNLTIDEISNKTIPIRKDLINSIAIDVDCSLYFDAPIYKNTSIGKITINIDSNPIYKLNIYPNKDINRRKWNNYLLQLFKDYSFNLNSLFSF